MRTGLVLAPSGGALERMAVPFKLFVGGRIGNGRQFMSWIHRDDVVAGYASAVLDARYTGPVNLVAGSVRNTDFAHALGHALHRPAHVPTPAFALRLAVGELAESILNGRNVVPARLAELGFQFFVSGPGRCAPGLFSRPSERLTLRDTPVRVVIALLAPRGPDGKAILASLDTDAKGDATSTSSTTRSGAPL